MHASCISFCGQGVLILGKSGAGKSAFAMQLMALGADLVADDQTTLTMSKGVLVASPPAAIAGLIEARGVGLLNCDYVEHTCVKLVVDLDHTEQKRLPERHCKEIAGAVLPCLYKVDGPHFPTAIFHFLNSLDNIDND